MQPNEDVVKNPPFSFQRHVAEGGQGPMPDLFLNEASYNYGQSSTFPHNLDSEAYQQAVTIFDSGPRPPYPRNTPQLSPYVEQPHATNPRWLQPPINHENATWKCQPAVHSVDQPKSQGTSTTYFAPSNNHETNSVRQEIIDICRSSCRLESERLHCSTLDVLQAIFPHLGLISSSTVQVQPVDRRSQPIKLCINETQSNGNQVEHAAAVNYVKILRSRPCNSRRQKRRDGNIPCPRDGCSKMFQTSTGLLRHVECTDPHTLLECPYCEDIEYRFFRREDQFPQHLRDAHRLTFEAAQSTAESAQRYLIDFEGRCPVCQQRFTDFYELYGRHYARHYTSAVERKRKRPAARCKDDRDEQDARSEEGDTDDQNDGDNGDPGPSNRHTTPSTTQSTQEVPVDYGKVFDEFIHMESSHFPILSDSRKLKGKESANIFQGYDTWPLGYPGTDMTVQVANALRQVSSRGCPKATSPVIPKRAIYYCVLCHQPCGNLDSWLRHINHRDPSGLWACGGCNMLFISYDSLVFHLYQNQNHASQDRICPGSDESCIYKGYRKRTCGFCGHRDNDWNRFWRDHVADHFFQGAEVSQWIPNYWIPEGSDSSGSGSSPPRSHEIYSPRPSVVLTHAAAGSLGSKSSTSGAAGQMSSQPTDGNHLELENDKKRFSLSPTKSLHLSSVHLEDIYPVKDDPKAPSPHSLLFKPSAASGIDFLTPGKSGKCAWDVPKPEIFDSEAEECDPSASCPEVASYKPIAEQSEKKPSQPQSHFRKLHELGPSALSGAGYYPIAPASPTLQYSSSGSSSPSGFQSLSDTASVTGSQPSSISSKSSTSSERSSKMTIVHRSKPMTVAPILKTEMKSTYTSHPGFQSLSDTTGVIGPKPSSISSKSSTSSERHPKISISYKSKPTKIAPRWKVDTKSTSTSHPRKWP